VSTAELATRTGGMLDAATIEAKTGIVWRHFADADATAAQLGAAALREALAMADISPEALARLIFVSSLGGDAMIPATSNIVAANLGLRGSCDCFDLNNACMGFLSALDVGARSVATGIGPVAIVAAELGSRFITPDDPRPYLVVGDGLAAAVLTPARDGEGIVAVWLRNDGTIAGDVTLGHAGLTGRRETTRFTSSNKHITQLAVEGFRRGVEAVLCAADLTLDDVQWIVLHQPNGSLVRTVVEALGLDIARVPLVVRDLGSVGATAIPITLDRLLRSGRARPGDLVLMAGVGGGASYGSMLVRL
jgi:3-oxoacyl-(acyl-carrier-protein) synthase III